MSIGIARPLLALYRQAGVTPGAPPPDERARVAPAGLDQLARHPGARRFVGSGTVDNERSVALEAELLRRAHGIIGRQPHRAARLESVLIPRARRARVDDLELLAAGDAAANVIDRDRRARRGRPAGARGTRWPAGRFAHAVAWPPLRRVSWAPRSLRVLPAAHRSSTRRRSRSRGPTPTATRPGT